MRQKREYKSPLAACVWSSLMPGFGQLYNKDYIIGVILIGFEILVNIYSNLNLALFYSFIGDFTQAHNVINYRWGMFYPSLYGFSIWQAYNSAKAHNARKFEQEVKQRTYLTGFIAGMVIGMDLGLFWHNYSIFHQNKFLYYLDMPVFNGILYGITFGFIGSILENMIFRKIKTQKQPVS
nr:hypothetical protein [Neobacillus sp. Marseille-Q6967]